MAYADKMCFVKDEYIEIKKLWLKTRKKQKRELGHEIWMYPFAQLEECKFDPSESNLDVEYMSDEEPYSVFNVSTKVELWLLKNFNLPCIKREVEKQLGEIFYQKIPDELRFNFVDDLDFSIPDTIYSIEHKKKDVSIWLFRQTDDRNIIETISNICLYGSTDFYKYLWEAEEEIKGYKKYGYKVQFSFCGLDLILNNGKIYYKNKELIIPYLKPDFLKLKIKHSYNIKDAERYKADEIFICSKENATFSLSDYKNANLKRLIFQLPEYLKNEIK